MRNLEKFAEGLAQLIGRPSDQRPFVCDGSPFEYRVFIVGTNAATGMSDFWQFWDDRSGFDKERWCESYLDERAKALLNHGKKKRQKVSSTRRVLSWIAEGAASIRILETNIYSTPTSQLSELEGRLREVIVLKFLLAEIRPRLVITHGKDAELHFARHQPSCTLRAYPHFARKWSKVQALELGLMIKDIIEKS